MASELKLPIYLDYQATTPVDPRVLDAMLPYFSQRFGNPASRSHEFGWTADAAVGLARKSVADLIGATDSELVFTSGSTESINLALQGVAHASQDKKHLITTQVEHSAVLDPCRMLERKGYRVTYLKPEATGRVSPEQIESAIEADTLLISVIAANNEIGTLNPMAEIGKVAKRRGVLFHTDATQAVGKIPVEVQAWGVDLLSFTAHKIYGPKGVGALYMRRREPRVQLEPLIFGGGHERGIRSGTLNVPGIVGFGKAAELAKAALVNDVPRIRRFRDELQDGLMTDLESVRVNGHPDQRLPDNLSLTIEGVDSEALMTSTRELAISAGSACLSGSTDSSHVLIAIGLTRAQAKCTLRVSIGRPTLEAEIKYARMKLTEKVREFRSFMRETE